MSSNVSEFLKRKMEERNLSIDGFSNSMGISVDLAKKYLSESGRYLPSDRVAKKISMVLKLTRDEESEFLRNLDQDRDQALPVDDIMLTDASAGPSFKASVTKLWVAVAFALLVSLLSLGLSIMAILNHK